MRFVLADDRIGAALSAGRLDFDGCAEANDVLGLFRRIDRRRAGELLFDLRDLALASGRPRRLEARAKALQAGRSDVVRMLRGRQNDAFFNGVFVLFYECSAHDTFSIPILRSLGHAPENRTAYRNA